MYNLEFGLILVKMKNQVRYLLGEDIDLVKYQKITLAVMYFVMLDDVRVMLLWT